MKTGEIINVFYNERPVANLSNYSKSHGCF